MPGRSIKIAPHHIERARKALERKSISQRRFTNDMEISRSVVSKFFTGKNIDQENFKEICFQLDLDWEEIVDKPFIAEDDPNFVGRGDAIATLNALVTQGAKVILIQGLGGIGKTTLAEKYLNDRFTIVIKFLIAREKKDIASIKGLLETKLRELGEEPGEELIVSLERLKQKLKTEKIGILIDNLEPALNGSGQFIQEHRSYVELLRALADSSLQSLTLITSREKLNEEGININLYRLSGLTKEAWQQYFDHQKIRRSVEHNTLKEIRDGFDGNAKAMDVISKAIITDYNRDLESYWLGNKEDLLIEPTLNNLIKKQFERLLDIKLNDAYNLLCRLGCYRYQDVPTVPEAGLICLLWDVAENQHKRIIKVLKERGLVECKDSKYFLHPVIREEAISRLRNSDYWEKANRQAAEFWTESVSTIENIEDAQKALESYHHYFYIRDYDKSASIIVNEKNNKYWSEPLDISFHRLGLLNPIINAVKKLLLFQENIKSKYYVCALLESLGDLYQVKGLLHESAFNHKVSGELATQYSIEKYQILTLFNQGLCKIDFWDIENAFDYFLRAKKISIKNSYLRYQGYCCFYLAFLYSLVGKRKESLDYIDEAFNIVDKKFTSWGIAYENLLLGNTYKELNLYPESFDFFKKSLDFAKDSNYPQVKGKGLVGLAELNRIKNDFDKAYTHHQDSIKILKKIGAKCDLAEAYFQLALTYQAMDNQPNSKIYFEKALDLWGPKQIDAPKQIERVKKAWILGSPE